MDPPAKPKSFRYNPPQQQQLHLQSPVFKSISHNKSSSFEDISFSSFLKPKDQNDAAAEISIFDAHKYFCETNNSQKKESPPPPPPPLSRLSSVSSDGYGRNSRTRSFHATPTASSEASWNSQTGLLVNPPGSVGVSLKNLPSRNNNNNNEIKKSSKNGIFRRKSSCCCTGGNSVCVKEATTVDRNNAKSDGDSHRAKPLSITSDGHHIAQIHPHKKISLPENINFPALADLPRQRRISASGRPFVDVAGGFSFPILKNPPTLQAEKPDPKGEVVEDPARDSLEVFQPNTDDPVNARQRFNSGSPRARVETTDDDLGSDASSDLFELESFSTQTTVYPTYRRRDSLDEALTFNARRFASANGLNPKNNAGGVQHGRRSLDEPPTPSVAATECYAPSEVSIDWSVTTAEGLDRVSVSNFSVSASEIGGASLFRQRIQEEGGGKRKGNGGGGLLLMSCRDGKAVSVGPQPVKCSVAEGGGGGTPVHVGGRPPRATKTTALDNDHSRRMSLAFAA